MTTIVSIVEGYGEDVALPVLLRRLGEWLSPGEYINVARPIRVGRNQFLNRPDVFSKQLQLAALKCARPGWILILLDADDDCPAELARSILERAAQIIPHQRISVVLANREYEAWFLASALSLNGKRNLRIDAAPSSAESVRGAKEWLNERISNGRYREVTDQPALSAAMDLPMARANSRSFHKLCCEWERNMSTSP